MVRKAEPRPNDRGTAGKVPEKIERWSTARFVNYDLSVDESARCKAWQPSKDELFDALDKLISDKYTVSHKHDERNDTFSCFVRGPETDNINAGLILSGRGSTSLKAFKQAMFKHWTLFDGDWRAFAEAPVSKAIDD